MCCTGKKAKTIATGFTYLAMGVNEELSKERMKFCNVCEYLEGGLICGRCKCLCKAKTRLPSESCPHPKGPRWEAELTTLNTK